MKAIVDIRFHCGVGEVPEALFGWRACQIGFRFAAALREEHGFSLGDYHTVLIEFDGNLKDQQIVVRGNRAEKWLNHVGVGISRIRAEQVVNSDLHDYLVDLIAKVLNELAKTDDERSAIEKVRDNQSKSRDDTIIQMNSRQCATKQYRIDPYFKIKGLGAHNMLLWIRVTDLLSGKVGDRLIIEANASEVHALVSSFSVTKTTVIAKQSKAGAHLGELYRNRGFKVPIEVPLDLVFAGSAKPTVN